LFIVSFTAASQQLENLATIDFDQAEFYLLDVTDNRTKVTSSIDAYRHQGDLYIALVPLFEGLRLKYSLIGVKLSVTFADQSFEFELLDKHSDKGQWFNDGSFIFIKASVLEQLFSTKITLNTKSLKMSLVGHTVDFPYKTIKSQQRQRKLNNYILDNSNVDQINTSGTVITIKDQYRLATVPTGYLSVEALANNTTDSYSATLQTESDLAYHSTSITLVHDDEETNSRVLLSRYPEFTGDKILGIWDQYNFGDLWLKKSSSTKGSSRGLGINFFANNIDNATENMTTSFAKTARPGWDADIYHNGVFMETRVVPNDGLMEFIDLEVYYGANEFKIVLYGPHGEQETVFERVNVKSNGLGQGDISYALSIKENDSSLLDFNLSEFDIDAVAANFSIGLLNNWQLGLAVDLNDIHNANGGTKSYRMINQITLPGWFFQNNTTFHEHSTEQTTSLATSFLNNDNLTLKYNSQWLKDLPEKQLNISSFNASYNLNFNSITNNLSYDNNVFSSLKSEHLNYRLSAFSQYFNVSNSLSYTRRNDTEDRFYGALNITTRVNSDLRFLADIPYDISGEEAFNPDFISASVLYNYRTENTNHSFNVSNRSFFKENRWSVGYNLAINKPTHQFTLRTQYDAQDKWSVRAGITINFGYDYFNNEMVLSSQTLRGAGSFDVHTYLDRQLNGTPDVLDYDLPEVAFSGGHNWDNVTTNQNGRARLFGARNGITALGATWKEGGATLNNDYLIYSHPGSLQRVNLPFYLTTELELFVVLVNGEQSVTLSNVPLRASNMSTGDEYIIETDFDGYASFVDLLPGKYRVYVEKEYLVEKGLQADIGGFEFNSPLKGGFVVLPNIELSRSESGAIGANELVKVLLDENNHIPLLDTDNDKLIHLPPKGGMKAPYSSDELHLAKFKEIKMQSTAQERRELRRKLASANKSSGTFNNTLKSPDSLNISPEIQSSNTQSSPVLVTPATPISITSIPDEQVNSTGNLSDQRIIADESGINQDLTSGYVVQFSAFKSLASATTSAQSFLSIESLNIIRKTVNGGSVYCVTSQIFKDQSSAREYLNTINKDGFIVDATKYIDIVWSK
jgi:hypothetical protein